jgi:hypothetical protein
MSVGWCECRSLGRCGNLDNKCRAMGCGHDWGPPDRQGPQLSTPRRERPHRSTTASASACKASCSARCLPLCLHVGEARAVSHDDMKMKAPVAPVLPLTEPGTPWAVARQFQDNGSMFTQFYTRPTENQRNADGGRPPFRAAHGMVRQLRGSGRGAHFGSLRRGLCKIIALAIVITTSGEVASAPRGIPTHPPPCCHQGACGTIALQRRFFI